ncbi:D-glycerate dehydrogenase [Halovulum dunhuangense]|uniref:D-glycerate dehydrogenase n=1 Tax=Halovulum dunhuangense TaxID=1505036 RepID=A0A849L5T0_9RHOB|nr:D-glycerate dehydrogenase [Halovulum dunhuangense]NNU81613.1 D-glycerate dehydrogenase [Halovulum dunhuangense]
MAPKPRIIATRKLPEAVETRLAAEFDAVLNTDDHAFTERELIAAMQEADGLLPTVVDRISDKVLDAGGKRRAQIVANFAVGVNNIDLDAAKARGVVVTNTPGVLTDATADVALTLMLNVTRRTWESERMLREGTWPGFNPTLLLGTGLQGKVLGIIGMGRIGKAVARRAQAGFGMKVIYYNRSAVTDTGVPAEARDSIEAVMAEADVISLHLPGGGANAGAISAERIALMKPSAYLINTARGDVIDEPALIKALTENRIAGAGLDVFAAEPSVPADLIALDNVSLLPHIGSATVETRTAMGMLAIDNLAAHFGAGDYPARVV